MERRAWIAGLLLACSFGVSAEAPSSLDFAASATLDVTPDGHARVVEMEKVTKLSAVPSLVPVANQIAQRLRERIEAWQFLPATRGGVAVASRTHLHVALRANDDGHGGMAVSILSASTGAAVRKRPMGELVGALLDFGSDSYVLADIGYASDGSVTDVEVKDQRSLSAGRFVPAVASASLRKGIERALKRWRFAPEIVAGEPIAGNGLLPMFYCGSKACDEAQAAMEASRGDAQFASSDPAVKLRTAVAGTAL